MIIPRPTNLVKVDNYNELYQDGYEVPKQLIRFRTSIENCVSISYDMDEEESEWLTK